MRDEYQNQPSFVQKIEKMVLELRQCEGIKGRKRFFYSSRRRHTRFDCDWNSDVCSSDLSVRGAAVVGAGDVLAFAPDKSSGATAAGRAEERRVGKECRARWSAYH